jgi:dipeptidyl aminopeptidase/acylaminoacyl peptidase
MLPVGYQPGKRYPLIMWVYSGTFTSAKVFLFGLERGDSIGASLNAQMLASHGYAVLVPDAPIKEGSVALDVLKTVMPALAKVVDMGIADSQRCGIFGHSFGGYATLALITQTARFRAAVAYAPATDLVGEYGRGPASIETGQLQLGGPLPLYPQRYIQNSPVFYLDRVTTPVLLIHGEIDALPISNSEAVFNGLKRWNKDVTFARYAAEGHILENPANVVDFWRRVIEFFNKYLKQ